MINIELRVSVFQGYTLGIRGHWFTGGGAPRTTMVRGQDRGIANKGWAKFAFRRYPVFSRQCPVWWYNMAAGGIRLPKRHPKSVVNGNP